MGWIIKGTIPMGTTIYWSLMLFGEGQIFIYIYILCQNERYMSNKLSTCRKRHCNDKQVSEQQLMIEIDSVALKEYDD